MELRLFVLIFLTGLFQGQCQSNGQVVPGLRVGLVPVLENGQIRAVQYLEIASTVTPESVKEQFSRRHMTLAKPLKIGATAQTNLP
ncbi:uncharacterized protein LOC117189027 [Drosophila miranda]|uniref:uncharacterized protein LOC117189027 n=1 Tax=Drosophila miranda TaxID=7229 RepID=UPI00143FA63C|nr:uncharacterized protein LOC117189027 [Drosophila miranda]